MKQAKKLTRKQISYKIKSYVGEWDKDRRVGRTIFLIILVIVLLMVQAVFTGCKSTTPAAYGDRKKPLVKSKTKHHDRPNAANWSTRTKGGRNE